ncbi:MAG: globin [Planctomycetota bacterium]
MSDTPIDPVGDLYERLGEPTIRALVRAFYAGVPGDPVLGPMYPARDLAGAEARLADFLVMRFGGPATYMEQRGHPRLRQRHAPYRVDAEAREHWVALMGAALDAEVTDVEARERAREFLADVATFLRNAE